MRIAIVTVLYKNIVNEVYDSTPRMREMSYAQQKSIIDQHVSLWASGWEHALKHNGCDVLTIPYNIKHLHFQWAKEHNATLNQLNDIVFEQIKEFQPEIIWYDCFDVSLLRRLKENIASVKRILGWSGSAIVDYSVLKEVDVVLSCAPEVVRKLSQAGMKCEQLHHAFNPTILSSLKKKEIKYQFSFIGQINRGKDFHDFREALLQELVQKVAICIFSSSYDLKIKNIFLTLLKKTGYYVVAPISELKLFNVSIEENKYLKEILRAKDTPLFPYNRVLKKALKPSVYGLEMFDTLFRSLVVLNVHADSSPQYASNMRLFETTGVGTCLLSDWKENIGELFLIDKEIIVYRSIEECVEKALWLLEHPRECIEIGLAGQRKTLADHTYEKRVPQLLDIIKKSM